MEKEKIPCKMCKEITEHMQIVKGMWKCMKCGEYNKAF